MWKIWHPQDGVLYDEGERLRPEAEAEDEHRLRRAPHPPTAGATRDESERAMLGDVSSYRYRCLHCQHEEDVPEVVVEGIAASAGLKPGRMPRLVCPNCAGPFHALGDSARERSEC